MAKSDRPTVFLSFLNGTEEEMYQLHEALDKSTLKEQFRFMITQKPIQAFSEQEALSIAAEIIQEDTPLRHKIVLNRMTQVIHYLGKAVEGIEKEIMILHENDRSIADNITSYASAISQHTNGIMPPFYTRMNSSGIYELQNAIFELQKLIPEEGELWEDEK